MTPSVPLWMPLLQAKAGILSMASLKAFEGFCSPQENPLYGKYFPELAEWIGQKRMVLPHKLSDEELANFYEELKETFEALEQIEEYFSCILHDIIP